MSSQGPLRFSRTIGFFNTEGRGFNFPVDLALGRDGTLYVISRGRSEAIPSSRAKVSMCTLEEDFLGEFSGGGTADGSLGLPVSIAIDKDENVYISDEFVHRISIFSKQGQFLAKWGVKGTGEGQFDRPSGITFDRDDNLLIVDSANNRIQSYNRDGQFLGAWGSGGSRDGEFNLPWGITTDQAGNVYVADWRNDRIQKFDSQGKHLATWGSSGSGDGEFNRPSWVAVDQTGNIYVTDWGNERLQTLGPDGSFLGKLRGESGLSKWAEDYFVSTPDELEEREKSDLEPELELLPDNYLRNESANIEKLFWAPTSVKVDDQGNVYVLESCRHRIQIYRTESYSPS